MARKLRSRTQTRVTTVPSQDPEESRRQKFERIGTARMNRVLTSIRLLGNLASPTYEYDEKDVQRINDTVIFALNKAMARFDKPKRGETPKFTFAAPKQEADA